MSQHANGINPDCYTYRRRPVELVYSSDFTDVWQAIAWEKTVKRWSRKKKEALIRGDYDGLPALAKNGYAKTIDRKIVVVRRAHHDNFSMNTNYLYKQACHTELVEVRHAYY